MVLFLWKSGIMQFLLILLVFIPHINGENNVQESHETPYINSTEYRHIGSPVSVLYENYFINFKNVRSINMSNNHIQTLEIHAFRNLTTLENIDLSLNQIKTLPNNIFSDTPKLESVILSNNNLSALQKHLFANLTYLRTVDIQFNNITYIEEHCFMNVPSLEVIKLAMNNLQTLQMNIIDDFRSLKTIDLGKNPWNCDPNLCELMHTVVSRFWQEPFVPMCYSPNGTRGATWKKVIESSMPAIITDLKDNVPLNKINFQCHTCTKTELFWRFENNNLTNNAILRMSSNYLTVSKFVVKISKFSNFEGNYTCLVDKCSTCTDSVDIYLKPASTTTRIIVWTFVIIIAASVTIYFIFFYGKSRNSTRTESILSLLRKK